MPSIELHRPHQLGLEEARTVVERVATRMQEKFGVQTRWDGDTLRFARQGVDGGIRVEPGQVHVSARLGMLLTPLKGMIEDEVRRKLDEYFGPV